LTGLVINCTSGYAQSPAVVNLPDSTKPVMALTPATTAYDSSLKSFLSGVKALNFNGSPLIQKIMVRGKTQNDYVFYVIALAALLLGLLKFFYSRYFANLFKVFFNTSLRQSQLTDQLLQARLPSLLFNIFFLISFGLFAYFLLHRFNLIRENTQWWIAIPACILTFAVIYISKFFTLIFTGWVTSFKDATSTYIFITFLINKIIGILLIPITVLMAFAQNEITRVAVIIAFIILAFMFLLRFFRSYGILQNSLRVSRFHFFLYILGIEILPILIIYKALTIYINKSV
jgi:Domain of unknown function (DUF4271)